MLLQGILTTGKEMAPHRYSHQGARQLRGSSVALLAPAADPPHQQWRPPASTIPPPQRRRRGAAAAAAPCIVE